MPDLRTFEFYFRPFSRTRQLQLFVESLTLDRSLVYFTIFFLMFQLLNKLYIKIPLAVMEIPYSSAKVQSAIVICGGLFICDFAYKRSLLSAGLLFAVLTIRS